MSEALLAVRRRVTAFYGRVMALKGVDLEPSHDGEIVTLIGANGAGKVDPDDDHLRQSAGPRGLDRVRPARRQ